MYHYFDIIEIHVAFTLVLKWPYVYYSYLESVQLTFLHLTVHLNYNVFIYVKYIYYIFCIYLYFFQLHHPSVQLVLQVHYFLYIYICVYIGVYIGLGPGILVH